jgi:hypothetical protein
MPLPELSIETLSIRLSLLVASWLLASETKRIPRVEVKGLAPFAPKKIEQSFTTLKEQPSDEDPTKLNPLSNSFSGSLTSLMFKFSNVI